MSLRARERRAGRLAERHQLLDVSNGAVVLGEVGRREGRAAGLSRLSAALVQQQTVQVMSGTCICFKAL